MIGRPAKAIQEWFDRFWNGLPPDYDALYANIREAHFQGNPDGFRRFLMEELKRDMVRVKRALDAADASRRIEATDRQRLAA